MNRMLQALLEDRFRLSVHRETKELPVYVLAVAAADRKLGPRLTQTRVDCVAVLAQTLSAERAGCSSPPFVPGQPPPCGSTGGVGQILAQGMTIAQLAANLSGRVNRVVVDKTELAGNFDINLEWTPDQFQGPGPLGALPGAPTPIARFIGPVDLYRAAGAARSQAGLGEGVNRRPRHRSRRTTHARLIEIRRRLLQFRDEVVVVLDRERHLGLRPILPITRREAVDCSTLNSLSGGARLKVRSSG